MKPYLIAEIAQAHDGSVGILHSYIDALSDAGVDAVKFQTHIAEAESSEHEEFRIPFSYVDKTRFDYWKRMELSREQWTEIKNHCDQKRLGFISSPFSVSAVNLLEAVGVDEYKIGSGEVNNYLLLNKIGQTGKPVILSSGMSDWDELDEAVWELKKFVTNVKVLQCTTAYPTNAGDWGLSNIQKIKDRYKCTAGFSDHSGNKAVAVAAVALGAEIIEVHSVFDKRMFGPDAKASLTVDEISWVRKSIDEVSYDLNVSQDKIQTNRFDVLKNMFGKSLAVNCNLEANTVLSVDHLETKKPFGKGIPAAAYTSVIGKRINRPMKQWEFLNQSDLAD